jgi:uncharacterized protein YbjT (DUF2867 family)
MKHIIVITGALNVTALTRLTYAAVPAFVACGRGTLVNIASIVGVAPELLTDSLQQRQHWLAEQVLNWSGLPVVHLRATVFLQHFSFLAWAA